MKDTLASQLLKLTVLIKINTSSQASSYGTGFLMSINRFIFLVTNKHVIEDAEKIHVKFFGQSDFTPIPNQFISSNNYDIAIQFLNKIPDTIECISENSIPSEEDIEELDSIEDIIFIGYPTGLYDKYNHSPIVRKGITATPLSLDYENKSLFLIDASIFPGSSGSPVFRICSNTITIAARGMKQAVTHFLLLGIVAEGYIQGQKKEICLSPSAPPPPVIYRQMIDLGEVIKTKEIIKLIENYIINFHTTVCTATVLIENYGTYIPD